MGVKSLRKLRAQGWSYPKLDKVFKNAGKNRTGRKRDSKPESRETSGSKKQRETQPVPARMMHVHICIYLALA